MFRKILFLSLFLVSFINPIFAINWVDVPNFKNKDIQLDTESIQHIDNYLFFNIKMLNTMKTQYRVLTIQSAFKHPYCKTISNISLEEYNSLNGNYQNITSNKTEKLEMAVYGSIAHSAYIFATSILNDNKPKVFLENNSDGIIIE